MPGNQMPIRLFAILAASIAGMTWAGWDGLRSASAIAAALAAIALAMVAQDINSHARDGTASIDAIVPARANAQLLGYTYGWGGLAMLAVYLLSGLSWRHGWQYGSGMLLIALGLIAYARHLNEQTDPKAASGTMDIMAIAALLQAIAASVALAIVFFSGKLRTPKDDWAANHIFVAGGLAIVVISLQAYATHRRLKARS
ncbi:MAG: hypothetical protein KDJ47_00740 [Hyphomicrobiaceae bacterium]|nr:hypothetical protein [Hyphomicrobiaceae bacterium]